MNASNLFHIDENVQLRRYNTFGIHATARFFCTIKDTITLQQLLTDPKWKNIPKYFLGGGSNVLFTQDFPGLVVRLKIHGIETLDENNDHVWLRVGAGENWHQFVMHCIHNNYAGVENLSLIPGTVGAAPMQNIGAYGVELKKVFHELEATHINNGSHHVFDNMTCQFGYRNSIFKNSHKNQYVITHVVLRLNKKPHFNIEYKGLKDTIDTMSSEPLSIKVISDAIIQIRSSKLPDPAKIGNAGSFFKNPVISSENFHALLTKHPAIPHFAAEDNQIKIPAAWLIEQCGWKGKRIGDIGVHDQQALVLVNHGNGNGKDLLALAHDIQASVKNQFGINLNPEVNII